jgi:hypothetical protein
LTVPRSLPLPRDQPLRRQLAADALRLPDYPAPVIRNIFPGGQIKSNFICAIGYGDPAGLFERLPRPDINEVCSFV